jgi:hypothetical protein
MKLNEIMDVNRPGKRGMQGYSDSPAAQSSTYGPRDAKRWMADAEQMGLKVVRIGQGTFQALTDRGLIAGEFDQRDGGMLAFDAQPVA